MSEVDPFARAVLEQRFGAGTANGPPLDGDFTEIGAERGLIDLLVGGTPCQSFSSAGKRRGLDDPRGNLSFEFFRLAERLQARWVVWENVPGVLSSNSGRDFGAILGEVEKCGYRWAYRVLDAQYHGVPQRRRRVILVGHIGDWQYPAAVLFEPEGLRGDSAPRQEARAEDAGNSTEGAGVGRLADISAKTFDITPNVAGTITTHEGDRSKAENLNYVVAHPPREVQRQDHEADTLLVRSPVLSFGHNKSANYTMRIAETTDALQASRSSNPAVLYGYKVRRLAPRECERLQGIPDDHTRIEWRGNPADKCPDGPRYKGIGNAMAVPVMRWIGERIQAVEMAL